jgi:hypothetical protein
MEYRKMFVDFLKSLKENPMVELTDEFIGSTIPQNDFSFKLILENFKTEVPKKLLAFYHSMSSCRIEWHCDLDKNPGIKKMMPEDTVVSGRIQILSIEKMLEFDKKLEAAIWQDNLSEEEKKELQNFRYMDFNDDYIRVGFILKNNKIYMDDIYFITQNSEGFTSSGLTLEKYFEKMIADKGYQGWQYNHFFPGSENSKLMKYYLSQIFK